MVVTPSLSGTAKNQLRDLKPHKNEITHESHHRKKPPGHFVLIWVNLTGIFWFMKRTAPANLHHHWIEKPPLPCIAGHANPEKAVRNWIMLFHKEV